ncbi:hypothetical protein CMI46_02545 [Candidatus Pacearchaeota archaeon]|nr:hypothetical protein [Candidatus Pacearchaeota archaeon]|tara:strand:- start:222 stop:710 length:489 start_codon:yes stop_codon:yes gene_type:complete
MSLILISAISDNGVIGKDGGLPWRIPEDMKRFKKLTGRNSVVMGRKTYESIDEKFRPLPNRKNIVLSQSVDDLEGAYVARTTEEALELSDSSDTYVIGGEQVYDSFLPLADKLEITKVHGDYRGDVFFPIVNWNEWNLVGEEKDLISKNGDISYSFLSYVRK